MTRVSLAYTPKTEEEIAARVKAIESILIEKGLMSEDGVNKFAELYENEVGPHLGAKVVAKAWSDPAFKQRLLADATKACQELDIGGLQGEHMIALECTDTLPLKDRAGTAQSAERGFPLRTASFDGNTGVGF